MLKRACGWCKQVQDFSELDLLIILGMGALILFECTLWIKVVPRLNRPYVKGDFYIGGEMLKELLVFVIIYLVVFLIYYYFIAKKYIKKRKKELVEIILLHDLYSVDVSKYSKKKLIIMCSLISSLIISLLVFFIGYIKSGIYQMILLLILIIPSILLIYYLFSRILIKIKENVKDE